MYLVEYVDPAKLQAHVDTGFIDVRHHQTLPLRIYSYSKEAVHQNFWDDTICKCRGLIVGSDDKIIARPFEKFFNVNTDFRPETLVANLPTATPIVTEKLDGSLGILYQFGDYHGIATKGSFHSDQAEWATRWYKRVCVNPIWPDGYTPVFEIIAESVQHHVVHYYGHEKLVLLALVNNETGEELDYNSIRHWAYINGLEAVDIYGRTVEEVLEEDRKNHEGYVLSWSRPGQTPLKVKVKHPNFLTLQKIVHAATPRSILAALSANNGKLLDEWTQQAEAPLKYWIQSWAMRFTFKYLELLQKGNKLYRDALLLAEAAPEHSGLVTISRSGHSINGESRRVFAKYVIKTNPTLARVCFGMLDHKDFSETIWKLVEREFVDEICKPFTTERDGQHVHENELLLPV